ncbi:MAG: dienelactone hydrolase family protein [Pseudonocardiaceae bacterium]
MAMTARRTEQIPLPDGSELWLTLAEPESAVRGGIVVVQEARGVTDAVRHLADGLAGEGWLAVVPHLYHRDGIAELPEDGSDDEQVRSHVERLCAASVLTDVDAVLGWLAEQGVAADRMGVVGFGLGGTVALIVAAERDLGAAVSVAGIGIVAPVSPGLPALVEAVPALRCPWLGVYGADDLVPVHEVHTLQHALQSAQVATHLVHFDDDTCHCADRQSAATAEAWTRTLNWFDSHLR